MEQTDTDFRPDADFRRTCVFKRTDLSRERKSLIGLYSSSRKKADFSSEIVNAARSFRDDSFRGYRFGELCLIGNPGIRVRV